MIATDPSLIKADREQFNTITAVFFENVKPFLSPSDFDNKIANGAKWNTGSFVLFTQTDNNKLDGYGPAAPIVSYLFISNGFAAGHDLNLCSGLTQSQIDHAKRILNVSLYDIGIFSKSRYIYTQGAAMPAGRGGAAGPRPIPFLMGTTWDPYRRSDGNIIIPTLDYMEAKRSPDFGDYSEHGNADRKATVRIVDKDGLCWYATSNYIITSIQKQEQSKFSKVETSEGDYITVNGIMPRFFKITGELLSMQDFQYAKNWQWNWDRYLKGNITNENNARFFLLYGGWILGGHLVNFQTVENSQSPFRDQFAFDIYVTDYLPLPNLTVPEKGIASEIYQSVKGKELMPSVRREGTWYKHKGLTLDEARKNNEEEV